MARYEPGVMGSFNGKAGTVVSSKWKSIKTIRAKGPSTRKNNAPGQVEQQARFSLALNFARNMGELFNTTFANFTTRMTAQNAVMKLIANDAITGDYPNFTIDYSKVPVSKGSLKVENRQNITLTVAAGILKWQWKFVPRSFGRPNTDKAVLIVYCPAFGEFEANVFGPDRSSNTATLDVTAFVGQTIETWLAFISADGERFSNSVYTGPILVA